jgi:MoxR-like ATPase
VEQEGTFELPEAQRDRFVIKTAMGYPDRAGELELIDRRANRFSQTPTIEAAVDKTQVRAMQAVPERVHVETNVREYLVDVARATRTDDRAEIGVSPRGIQRFFEAARARAVVAGRDYVTPDDVKFVADPVMRHRIVLTPEANIQGATKADVVDAALASVDVPDVTGA